MRITRVASLVGSAALAALLTACASEPTVSLAPVNYPAGPGYAAAPGYGSSPSYAPAPGYSSANAGYVEYGQVINIDYIPGGTARTGPNVPGAIIGAVAGAVLGNQIGSGGGRDAATVLGGAAGAAVGSQVGRSTSVTDPVYRITLRTEQGVVRTYDVPVTGDLRVGDRVRVENGLIYRG